MGRRATETLEESVGRCLCRESSLSLIDSALPCLGSYPEGHPHRPRSRRHFRAAWGSTWSTWAFRYPVASAGMSARQAALRPPRLHPSHLTVCDRQVHLGVPGRPTAEVTCWGLDLSFNVHLSNSTLGRGRWSVSQSLTRGRGLLSGSKFHPWAGCFSVPW